MKPASELSEIAPLMYEDWDERRLPADDVRDLLLTGIPVEFRVFQLLLFTEMNADIN